MDLRFEKTALPEAAHPLRKEVRAFLAEVSQGWSLIDRARSWVGFDRDFSREVGKRGWIGMTWPKPWGGERSSLERYVVQEEMLAAGAPVGAHWVSDRQSGPIILRVGTDEQRAKILPQIVKGECAFCIGMSEPDAGSDLAAIRSRAVEVEGGWRLNGRKVWTTNAHLCDYMIGLFRTGGPADKERQAGLTQFLVDLSSSGLEVRRIRDLTGEEHFNEVLFDNVFVPSNMVLGAPGDGWKQVTAELAFERSGPERYLSAFPLLPPSLDALAGERGSGDDLGTGDLAALGDLIADFAVLRQMSLSVAGMLGHEQSPAKEAALVKDLGAVLEQRTPEVVRQLFDGSPPAIEAMLGYTTMVAPAYSLRGGTREILRGITARSLGLR